MSQGHDTGISAVSPGYRTRCDLKQSVCGCVSRLSRLLRNRGHSAVEAVVGLGARLDPGDSTAIIPSAWWT